MDLDLDLEADEMGAALRFVAKEAPHLIVALVWSMVTNPGASAKLRELGKWIEPWQLEELASLDPAVHVAVEASEPARRRRQASVSGRRLAEEKSAVEFVLTGDVERDVGQLGLWVGRVAARRPELVPAVLAHLCSRTATRLTLRGYRVGAEETRAIGELAVDFDG